jgi:hypothetical protein
MTDSPRHEPPLSSEPNPFTPLGSNGSTTTAPPSTSTSDVAKERAGDVRDSAKDAAASVAGTAKEQAGQVFGEAGAQARDLLSQGRAELSDQARSQQQRAAGSLHALSSQLHEMAANAPEPGLAQDLTGQVAGHAASLAAWLDDREPGAVLEEVREYARRRPGTFLALCAGAGVLAGRLGRGLQAEDPSVDERSTPTETRDATTGSDVGEPVHGYAAPGVPTTPAAVDTEWAAQGQRA